jgi:hypothetical protein
MQQRLAAGALVLGLLFPFLAPHAVFAAWVNVTPWPPQQRQIDVGSTAVVGSIHIGILPDDGESASVTSVTLTGADASDFSTNGDQCVGSRGGCWVEVSFTPSRLGVERAVLEFSVESSTQGIQTASAPIYGIGGPIGALCGFDSFPKSTGFNDTFVGQTQTPGEFQRPFVVNCGGADLHVSDVVLGGDDAADFQLGPSTCVGTWPVTDPPGQQGCIIDIAFAPQSPGQKSATLTIVSDGLDAPQVYNLSGRARAVADLAITMQVTTDPDPAERGGLATYEITMTNLGPNTAEAAYMGWWFNYEGAFESVPADAICGPFYWGGPGASCALQVGDLAVGESHTVIATVRIGESGIPGVTSATALNGSSTADLGYDNNGATAEFPVEDLEPPTIRFDGNAGTYRLTDGVYIPCIAEDNAGIDWSRTTCPWTVGAAYEFNLGVTTVSATAYDTAGYRADASTTFEVVADYASVRWLTEQWTTKASIRKELLVILATAERAQARGNAKAEASALADYRSLVKAQSGKAIDPANAAVLTRVSFGL